MPHIAFVPFSGLRVGESELLSFGMTLPGLQKRAEALSTLPSLGLLTLAGMTPKSWTVSYHSNCDSPELFDEVLATKPKLVAISALTASIDDAYSFSDRLRRAGIVTVIGGLHVTACPGEAMEHATAICVGDGESVWPTILSDAENGSLSHQYHSSIPFDLANSPRPRFDLLIDSTTDRLMGPQRWTLQTERGCPLACDFCAASRLLGPFREKPIANIVDELSAIKKLDKSPWVELADDNTFVGERDVGELCQAIGNAGVRFFTESDWRIGERPDDVAKLASAGCVQLLLGIESLTFRYPGMGQKHSPISRIIDAVNLIQDAGIAANGCFILGADGETLDSLDRLTEFIMKGPFAEIQLTLQTPFPGTTLYERLRREDRLLSSRGWKYYTLFDVVFQPDCLTVGELESGFRQVMSEVFSVANAARRSSIRRRVWSRHPSMRRRV